MDTNHVLRKDIFRNNIFDYKFIIFRVIKVLFYYKHLANENKKLFIVQIIKSKSFRRYFHLEINRCFFVTLGNIHKFHFEKISKIEKKINHSFVLKTQKKLENIIYLGTNF